MGTNVSKEFATLKLSAIASIMPLVLHVCSRKNGPHPRMPVILFIFKGVLKRDILVVVFLFFACLIVRTEQLGALWKVVKFCIEDLYQNLSTKLNLG